MMFVEFQFLTLVNRPTAYTIGVPPGPVLQMVICRTCSIVPSDAEVASCGVPAGGWVTEALATPCEKARARKARQTVNTVPMRRLMYVPFPVVLLDAVVRLGVVRVAVMPGSPTPSTPGSR